MVRLLYLMPKRQNMAMNLLIVNENDAANDELSRRFIISEPQISSFYAIFPRREFSHYGTHQIIVYSQEESFALKCPLFEFALRTRQ